MFRGKNGLLILLLLFMCTVLQQVQIVKAIVILTSGWEDSEGTDITDKGKWRIGTGSPEVTTYPIHHGNYSIKFDGISDYLYTSFIEEKMIYVGFAWQYSSDMPPGSYLRFLILRTDFYGTILMMLQLKNDNGTLKWGINYYNNGISYDAYSEQRTNPEPNKWHFVVVNFNSSSGDNTYDGALAVYIDSVELTDITKTGIDTDGLSPKYLLLGNWGCYWGCLVQTVDCFILSTNSIQSESHPSETPRSPRLTLSKIGYEWLYKYSGNPLTTPTHDGVGQPVHPDVLYFPNGWRGYKFWMVYTPYTSAEVETPNIVVSNDGINWQIPAGGSNPIEPMPAQGINSDPELYYDEENDVLWVYFRYYYDGNEIIYAKNTTDGINWTEKIKVLSGKGLLSPSIVKVGSTLYMWTVNSTTTPNTVNVRTSTTGLSWDNLIISELEAPEAKDPWHLDVIYINGIFYMLLTGVDADTSGERGRLYYGISKDGINWTLWEHQIIPLGPSGNWDDYTIYRSSNVFINNTLWIYYSAMSSSGIWHIGLAKSAHILKPENISYIAPLAIPVEIVFGLPINAVWFNLKNETSWVYSENQTYTVPTQITNLTSGKYCFYAWFNISTDYIVTLAVNFSIELEKLTILERLIDIHGNPVNATVSLNSFSNTTDIQGYYSLTLYKRVYDILFDIANLFIQNFWLKLLTVNISSLEYNKLTHITNYTENKSISLIFNITGNQTILNYSPEKPRRVLKNSTALKEFDSTSDLLANYGWFYNETEKIVYVKFSETL